jgi:O-antigen ligase
MCLPFFLAGLYFSYTRSIWMGAGVGLVIVLATTLRGKTRLAVLGTLVAGGVLVSAAKFDKLMAFQREQSAGETKTSADMRLSFAYVSWRMFQERPLAGFGFGQFPQAKLAFLGDRSVDLQLETIRLFVHHNTFLSLLTETGLIGFALFCGLLVLWWRDAWAVFHRGESPPWARRHAALVLGTAGVYVCQLVFHELSYSTLDNCLIFFLAGMTSGIRHAVSGEPVELKRVPQPVAAGAAGSELFKKGLECPPFPGEYAPG